MSEPPSAARRTGLFYGYYIAAACCVIQGVNLGGVFTFGVLFPELEQEFGWSRTTISGATSFAIFIMGGCAVFMGRAGDKFGPRVILTLAGILFGLGYAFLYRLQAAWELYLYLGLLVGIGLAAHDVCTLSTIARWFVRRRGLMSGIVKAGAGGGQVIVPIAMAALITSQGWRFACLVFGIAAILMLVVAAQLMRRNPQSMGLPPDGNAKEAANRDHPHQEDGASWKDAIRSKTLWILCIAKFFDLFCLFTVIVHIVPFAVDHGLGRSVATGVLSTIGAMSIAGRIILGGAYDRIGARTSLMICFAVLASSLVLLQFAGSAWSLFLFAVIYGPAHGGFFTITSPSVAEYFGTRTHGTLFGLVVTFGTLGATVGPLVAGGLFDAFGNYTFAFALLLGFSFAGLAVAGLLPRNGRPRAATD